MARCCINTSNGWWENLEDEREDRERETQETGGRWLVAVSIQVTGGGRTWRMRGRARGGQVLDRFESEMILSPV